MTDNDFRQWASRLTSLTKEQIAQVQQRLRLLGSTTVDIEQDKDDWLFPGIVRALKHKGMISASSVYALQKSRSYKRYKSDISNVLEELEQLLEGPKSASREKLALLTGRSLIAWCETKHLPKTSGTVISMICHSREALEFQFPGYIGSDMFNVVLKGLPEFQKELT